MKVTLRKASVLQNSLQDLARSISLKTSVSISEFAKPDQVLLASQNEFDQQLARKRAAIAATYAIRSAVAAANNSAGINQLLTDVARVQAEIALLEQFQNQAVEAMMPSDELDGRLQKIRNQPADARRSLYGVEDTVTTGILPQSRLNQLKADLLALRKQKQTLQDQILELNVRTEIELGDAALFLKQEGLI